MHVEQWFKHVLNLPELIGISTKVHVHCVEQWFKQLNLNVLIGYMSGVLKVMLLYNSTSRQAEIMAHCSNRDWYSFSVVWHNHNHWEHGFFLQEV